MARLEMRVEQRGMDRLIRSMESVVEALDNAHVEDACFDVETPGVPARVTVNGVTVAMLVTTFEAGVILCETRPRSGMILFIAQIMALLPSTATVAWQDGWPHVTCPPHEHRDAVDDPTPLHPDELVPA